MKQRLRKQRFYFQSVIWYQEMTALSIFPFLIVAENPTVREDEQRQHSDAAEHCAGVLTFSFVIIGLRLLPKVANEL